MARKDSRIGANTPKMIKYELKNGREILTTNFYPFVASKRGQQKLFYKFFEQHYTRYPYKIIGQELVISVLSNRGKVLAKYTEKDDTPMSACACCGGHNA